MLQRKFIFRDNRKPEWKMYLFLQKKVRHYSNPNNTIGRNHERESYLTPAQKKKHEKVHNNSNNKTSKDFFREGNPIVSTIPTENDIPEKNQKEIRNDIEKKVEHIIFEKRDKKIQNTSRGEQIHQEEYFLLP